MEAFDTPLPGRYNRGIIMATPSDPNPANAENTAIQLISTKDAATIYSNFCRGALTPEEVILDFGFNANSFGVKVLEEDIQIQSRVILSPATAKRLLLQLNEMVRRHEGNFGEIEMDFRRRVRPQPAAGNGQPPPVQ